MKIRSLFAVLACSCALAVCFGVPPAAAAADGSAVLLGRVLDVDGRGVEGAQVFVYDSTDVRRSATFISAATDREGRYRMVLLPGRYWVVARLKRTEGYGPLMPGDKHSGDPAEIDALAGQEANRDLVVADLRDARAMRTKDREGPIRISGRILDDKGAPLRAYAVAQKRERTTGIPDYVSAWTDIEGRYTLFLPKGTYFFGSALLFPPGPSYCASGEIIADKDRAGLDVLRSSRSCK